MWWAIALTKASMTYWAVAIYVQPPLGRVWLGTVFQLLATAVILAFFLPTEIPRMKGRRHVSLMTQRAVAIGGLWIEMSSDLGSGVRAIRDGQYHIGATILFISAIELVIGLHGIDHTEIAHTRGSFLNHCVLELPILALTVGALVTNNRSGFSANAEHIASIALTVAGFILGLLYFWACGRETAAAAARNAVVPVDEVLVCSCEAVKADKWRLQCSCQPVALDK